MIDSSSTIFWSVSKILNKFNPMQSLQMAYYIAFWSKEANYIYTAKWEKSPPSDPWFFWIKCLFKVLATYWKKKIPRTIDACEIFACVALVIVDRRWEFKAKKFIIFFCIHCIRSTERWWLENIYLFCWNNKMP